MISQENYKPHIDARIKVLLARFREDMAQTHLEFAEMLDQLKTLVERGGKRLRPYLIYVGYNGYGGRDLNKIIDIGVALEFSHLFLLIHDDIIDQDTVRYGGPNLTGTYEARLSKSTMPRTARQAAEGVALLGGDVAHILAQRTLLEAGMSYQEHMQVFSLFNHMMLDVAAGELLDLLLPLEAEGALTFEQVQEVYINKTASYSVVVPLQLGNMLAGGSAEERMAIAKFATPLGVAYQIKDDILGMFGEEKDLGKSNTSDMRQGKHTPLYVYAMENATASQKETLHRFYGNQTSGQEELLAVRNVLVECGALDMTQNLMYSYAKDARTCLTQLRLNDEARLLLENIVASSLNRAY